MGKERFFELLTKKVSGEISLAEQVELARWISANPDDALLESQLLDVLNNDWLQQHSTGQLVRKAHNWDKLHAQMHKEEDSEIVHEKVLGIKPLFKWLAAAGVLIFVIAAAMLLLREKKPDGINNSNIVATKKGSKSNLVLPDGSKVWINSDSKISYEDGFGKTHRTLVLTGEAYFDVVKDAERPFLIHTSELDVKVLGTAFNVRSYPDEENVTTTLVRGSLQVALKKYSQDVYVLKPDEKLVVSKKPSQPQLSSANDKAADVVKSKIIKTDSIPPEAQWTNNTLVFIDKRLDEVAVILSRWYGVSVIIDGSEKMKAQKYSGFYDNQSIQNVLESLKFSAGFHYKIENNTVLIEP